MTGPGLACARRFAGACTLALVVWLAAPQPSALAGCELKTTELPVTMLGLAPVITAKINDTEVRMLVDSGAFFSLLTPAAVQQHKLKRDHIPGNLRLKGIGGEAEMRVTRVDAFTLANTMFKDVEFVVAGNELGNGAAGVLGQSLLRAFDVEYDLGNGAIRLARPGEDCKGRDLAYWTGGKPHSAIDIEWTNAAEPHTVGTATINGRRIRVMFDTGAAVSILSLYMAERLGVKPGGQDVVPAGSLVGIGRHRVEQWIAPFDSFKIGDEAIHNTRIRIADLGGMDWDMILGADFFLSHRIYVANSQRKLYFSYSGGPVFSLTTAPAGSPRGGEDPTEAEVDAAEPASADAYSRRGMAFLARRDVDRAIADLSRACELAPGNAIYFYQRALARQRARQNTLAMADLDQALQLQPELVDARMARAEQRLADRDIDGARADLDEAARLTAPEADLQLPLGRAYVRARSFDTAVTHFDLWIGAHVKDVGKPEALAGRCEARALGGFDLDQALTDCNAALAARENSQRALGSRAILRLRRGEYEKAIGDFDAALALQSRDAWSMLGRGIARQYLGHASEGQADVAAAEVLRPGITATGRALGIAGPVQQASP